MLRTPRIESRDQPGVALHLPAVLDAELSHKLVGLAPRHIDRVGTRFHPDRGMSGPIDEAARSLLIDLAVDTEPGLQPTITRNEIPSVGHPELPVSAYSALIRHILLGFISSEKRCAAEDLAVDGDEGAADCGSRDAQRRTDCRVDKTRLANFRILVCRSNGRARYHETCDHDDDQAELQLLRFLGVQGYSPKHSKSAY